MGSIMIFLGYLLGVIFCYLATGAWFAVQYHRWYVQEGVKPWIDLVIIVLMWPRFAVV